MCCARSFSDGLNFEQYARTSRWKGNKENQAVERCGLMSVLGKDIGQLSKGYRQRVGLAQAILHDPDLLILDEPTSGLDPNQIVEIRDLIKELGSEKTVILSTHILSEVQSTCSRVLIINDGKLVADDAPEQLTAGDGGTVTVVLATRQGAGARRGEGPRRARRRSPASARSSRPRARAAAPWASACATAATTRARELFEAAVKHELVLLEVRRAARRASKTPSAS